MTPEVTEAIEDIKRMFPGHDVAITPEKQGGAIVVVSGLDIGSRFTPSLTWCGFAIAFQYPDGDVYPHFLDGAVVRADKGPLPPGITGPSDWQGRQALQVSRRSNRWHAAHDTAALKLLKVLAWLRSL